MKTALPGILVVLLVAGCSREDNATKANPAAFSPSLIAVAKSAVPPPEASSPEAPSSEASSSGASSPQTLTDIGVPVPAEEPSEEVLRKLEFARYDAINKMGGMPVTVTATGRSYILRPTLYAVRKESCTPTPQAPAGWYECSLTITVSLADDGSDPSEQGERIGVKWDPKGEWVTQ